MFRFLNYLRIDTLSYILGIITGLLVAGLYSLSKIALPKLRSYLSERMAAARADLTAGADTHFRREALRQAQKSHLAAMMFGLDEILIKPQLMALPPLMLPGSNMLDELETTVPIPYLPAWPELGAVYHGRTISIPEALSRGANIAIVGIPGAGKTTALAYLVSLLARRSEDAGVIKDHLPVLVHVSELGGIFGAGEAVGNRPTLDVVIDAVIRKASLMLAPRLPGILRSAFHQGQVLLMIDGMDELPPEQVDKVVVFVARLIEQNPKTRLVLTASPAYFGGILPVGILPVALAGWDERKRTEFLTRWADMWNAFISPGVQRGPATDPLIITGWLGSFDYFATPLEVTLKFWAAFSGDSLGGDLPASVDAYLRRMTVNIGRARDALEKLAVEMVRNSTLSASSREAEGWLGQLKNLRAMTEPVAAGLPATGGVEGMPSGWKVNGEPAQAREADAPQPQGQVESPTEATGEGLVDEQNVESPPVEAGMAQAPAGKAAGKAPKMSPAQEMLAKLVEAGILQKRADRYHFVHPIIAGYLAAAALARDNADNCLENQPDWIGKQVTLPFMAGLVDLSRLATQAVEETQDPLYRKLLAAGRWLRLAPTQARWRGSVLRQLVNLLQSEIYPVTLRAQALSALVSSGDAGITALLKSMFAHRQENVRILAAFGCGLARDQKAVGDLIQLTGDPASRVSQAAVLALAAIGNRPALDAIGSILLNATEDMRRSAAEALAFLPEEGHPALKEGSTMEDLLVRRAVVYGLARVDEPWALEMLQKMQIEDGQWVVRSAATQALEEIQRREIYFPQSLPLPQESPWLLEYAAKQGLGVLPGKPAMNLMVQALKSDNIYETLAALAYLERLPDPGSVPGIYQVMYGSGGELKEMSYHSLWQLAGSGVPLLPPAQFGLG